MKLLNKYRYQFGIFLIILIIFIVNYSRGKYLCGWDSLQTELNPILAITRAFEASWQEYQSFGLPAGMAHAADLVRAIFVWVIAFILPQNIVRYFFHILMLLVGGLGAFQLFRFCFDKSQRDCHGDKPLAMTKKNCHSGSHEMADRISALPAFLGALFYMLNLGTLQIFYVPFEPFSIFFAALPWEIYYFLKYIEPTEYRGHNEKSTQMNALIALFLVNFIATPQAYLQTIFFVYILILGFLALPFVKNWKKILIAFLTIFIVNSFWIFPQIYFLKNNTVTEAKINQLATENVYYQNKEKGTLDNFVRLEGFYFDLFKSDKQALFAPWKNYLEKPYVKYLSYAFAFIFLLGIFYKSKYRASFLLSFGLIAIALLNNTQPFAFVNDLLRQNNLINQVFRSPFTKFIIPYSLVASYFLVSGIFVILEAMKWLIESLHLKTKMLSLRSSMTKNLFYSLILLLLALYSLPVFSGNLFSSSMKVNIPKDYLETIAYFKTIDKNERIALLPEYTFWGWYYTNWGYNGSGFLWYGIEQPIVSRTFDVWSKTSEGYFWELKNAFEREDIGSIKTVFEKYDINYLILDKSLLSATTSLKGMQIDHIRELLTQIPALKIVKNYNNLTIYKIDNSVKNYLYTSSSLPSIGPDVSLTNQDTAFQEFGDYATQNNKNPDIYYPFLDLFSQTNIPTKKWEIIEQPDSFLLKSELNFDPTNYTINKTFTDAKALLYKDNKEITYQNNYQILINKNNLVVKIPKNLIKNFSGIDYKQGQCSYDDKTICFSFDAPYADAKYSYLLSIRDQNISGRRFFFYVLDQTNKQSYLEDRLLSDNAMYFLPQRNRYGLGYSFSFQNNSYEGIQSQNTISNIDLYLFPYEAIKSISLSKSNYSSKIVKKNTNIISQKNNYYWYEVQLKNNVDKYLILNQAYNDGWTALSSGTLRHLKINNWANGFDINNIKDGKILIIYWPQALQFLGYLLLLVYYILIKYEKNNHRS